MHTQNFALVVAATSRENGIGKAGKLPWHPQTLKADMNWFKTLTCSNYMLTKDGKLQLRTDDSSMPVVLMGRKTWESISSKFRPLPKRKNVILSRSTNTSNENNLVLFVSSFEDTWKNAHTSSFYFIGGSECYKLALKSGKISHLFLTRIIEPTYLECDTFFPELDSLSSPIDITSQVAELIEQNSTYSPTQNCFIQEGFRYKMFLYILDGK
jgi:dihydrofolate reductase